MRLVTSRGVLFLLLTLIIVTSLSLVVGVSASAQVSFGDSVQENDDTIEISFSEPVEDQAIEIHNDDTGEEIYSGAVLESTTEYTAAIDSADITLGDKLDVILYNELDGVTVADTDTTEVEQQDGFMVQITNVNGQVTEGDEIDVDYEIENTADTDDSQDIFLRVEGTIVDAEEALFVASGDAATGSFQYVSEGDDPPSIEVSAESDDDQDAAEVWVFAEQDWPQHQADSANTGTNVGAGPVANANPRWVFETGGRTLGDPSVVDGVVYATDLDNYQMFALDTTSGTELWSYETGHLANSAPALWRTLVFAGTNSFDGPHEIHAVDIFNATQEWVFTEATDSVRSITVANDMLYLGTFDGDIFSLSPDDGSIDWQQSLSSEVRKPPAVVDGTVYIGASDNSVYALNSETGNQEWDYTTGDNVEFSPTVVEGTVYVGSTDGWMYALDAADGTLKWATELNDAIDDSAAVSDGTVYVGDNAGRFAALDATDGSVEWTSEADSGVNTAPAAVGDAVYFGTADNTVFALNAADGSPMWSFSTDGTIRGSPTVVDGTVYTSTFEGTVYALEEFDIHHPEGLSSTSRTGDGDTSTYAENLLIAPVEHDYISFDGADDWSFHITNSDVASEPTLELTNDIDAGAFDVAAINFRDVYEPSGTIATDPQLLLLDEENEVLEEVPVIVDGDEEVFTDGDTFSRYDIELLDDIQGEQVTIASTDDRLIGIGYEANFEQDSEEGDITVTVDRHDDIVQEDWYVEFSLRETDTIQEVDNIDGQDEFTVTIDASDLEDGEYSSGLRLFQEEGDPYGQQIIGLFDRITVNTQSGGGGDDEEEALDDEPTISVSPSSVDFDFVDVGENVMETLTVENKGADDLSIFDISIEGDDAFELDGSISLVEGGESKSIDVIFDPSAAEEYNATVVIESNDPDDGEVGVELTGVGAKAVFELERTEVDFGSVAVDGNYSEDVRIWNNGTAALDLEEISITGAEAFSVDEESVTLPADSSETLTVRYAPTDTDEHSAILAFEDADGELGTVDLSGGSRERSLSVEPDSIDYGNVSVNDTASETITITTDQDFDVEVENLSVAGTDASAFEMEGGDDVVGPGEGVERAVTFTPLEPGDYEARIDVFGPDGREGTVELAGNATAPEMSVEPGSIQFGEVEVDDVATETVTVENTGDEGEVLEVRDANLTDNAAFSLEGHGDFELEPGDSHDLEITFAPESEDQQSTQLTLRSNDPVDTNQIIYVSSGNVEANVTLDEEDRITTEAVIRDAEAGVPAQLDMPAPVEEEAYQMENLEVTPEADGDIEINTTSSSRELDTTPAERAGFENATSQRGNLSVDSNLDRDQIQEVSFEYTMDRQELAALDSSPEDVDFYRYDEDAERWEQKPTEIVSENVDEVTFRSTGTGFSEWTAAAQRPDFDVTDTQIEVTTAEVDQELLIQVIVTNWGGADGTYEAELLFDDEVVDSEDRTVPANGTVPINFERSFDEVGIYEVLVNDVFIAEVDVTEPDEAEVKQVTDEAPDPLEETEDEATDDPDGGIGWLPIAAGLLLLGVVAAGGYLLYHRRGPPSEWERKGFDSPLPTQKQS